MAKHLTLSEMAERLHRSVKTFRKYVDLYNIPHIRLGKDFLFDPDVVIAYLTERSTKKPKETQAHRKLKVKPQESSDRGRFAEALGL